jgi:hypothetical protein
MDAPPSGSSLDDGGFGRCEPGHRAGVTEATAPGPEEREGAGAAGACPGGRGRAHWAMGWLARHWAELVGVLLAALVVALQVAESRLTPFGGPHAIAVAAAWWALLLSAVWYLAVRPRGR